MGKIEITVTVEVFPDGATSWLVRGSARRQDTREEIMRDWFEISAESEAAAYNKGAVLIAQQLMHQRPRIA